MRLLHVQDLSVQYQQKDAHRYAILSHRWMTSETKLKDIESGHITPSTVNKVSNFAKYVRDHIPGVNHIWVDSCCINQDSAAELSEGVNCMFDWYRNATICVVYLHDVEHPSDMVALRNSVWFTRGWTLQELLASMVVVFLTNDWRVIGHKGNAAHIETDVGQNIETILAERTMIPLDVLRDFSVSYSLRVGERLRWMDGRETLKEEDMSYALFGIFGVTPGANYGEKRHGARQRLMNAIAEDAADHEKTADIKAWLSAPDPSTNHASACERHATGTCRWLLQHEQYTRWKAGTIQHLWLHGKAGCGKSVLCSTVIHDLQEYCRMHANAGLMYFYFTFSDARKQGYDDLILGLIIQLLGREPARSMMHHLHQKESRPNTQELENILISTVATLDQAYLVLDALDESPALPGTRRDLLMRLTRLLQSSKLTLFATSRYIPDISDHMEDLSCEQIPAQPCEISSDIQLYATAQLRTEPRLRRFTPVIKSMIESNVSDNADGMFRWAFLLLDKLATLRRSDQNTLEAELKRFPKDLNHVYARILQDLDEKDKEDALTLLCWITYARQPLSLGQLIDALIIEPENVTVDMKGRGQAEDTLRLLTSLVVTITDKDTDETSSGGVLIDDSTRIRLAHFTVQEFLESDYISAGESRFFYLERHAAHLFLTRSCVTYILHYSTSEDKKSSKNDFTTFPLLQYAAESWYYHSLLHQPDDVEYELKLLQIDTAMRDWLVVHQPDITSQHPFDPGYSGSLGSKLYYASFIGQIKLIELLVDAGANVNAQGGFYGSALQAASSRGHLGIVKLLVDAGADIDAQGGYRGSALYAASEEGHLDIVKLLVDAGADINAQGGFHGSALCAASSEGQLDIVKLLVGAGADIDAQEDGSALCAASEKGHLEVMKLLLSAGAHVNARRGDDDDNDDDDYYSGSALCAATSNGHMEAVKLLVNAGADVNVRGDADVDFDFYRNALAAATSQGHLEVVKLLVNAGANVNAHRGDEEEEEEEEDDHGNRNGNRNALQAASYRGDLEIVKLLVDAGADVNAQASDFLGGDGRSAIHAASDEGHLEIVKLLVDAGADVNAQGRDFDGNLSALQSASGRGHMEIIQLLLKHGAEDVDGALQATSRSGHTALVKLLTRHGAKDVDGALQAACSSRTQHLETVRLLLEYGAKDLDTALRTASGNGHTEILKLLLQHGAKDVEDSLQAACSDHYQYLETVHLLLEYGAKDLDAALQTASGNGHTEILKLLLQHGATDVEGALQAACYSHSQNLETVRMLLEYGAKDLEGALQGASRRGHPELVKLLVGHGAKDVDGALAIASFWGRTDAVQLLLEYGANVNAAIGSDGRMLQAACYNHWSKHETVKLLLQHGADVNAQGGQFGNALQAACAKEYVSLGIVKLLVEHGADVNAQGGKFGSALQAACSNKGPDLGTVRLLLQHGADINAQGGKFGHALQAARQCGNDSIVRLLEENGALA